MPNGRIVGLLGLVKQKTQNRTKQNRRETERNRTEKCKLSYTKPNYFHLLGHAFWHTDKPYPGIHSLLNPTLVRSSAERHRGSNSIPEELSRSRLRNRKGVRQIEADFRRTFFGSLQSRFCRRQSWSRTQRSQRMHRK